MVPRWKLVLIAVLAFAGALAGVFAAIKLAAPPETADALFARAKARATVEHKNVLLVFSASWCGPCKRYERFLENGEMRAITEKAFVVQRIEVGEHPDDSRHQNTPGGEALLSALGANGKRVVPFLMITDKNGEPIVNSYRNGDADDSIGYPVDPSDIDWYCQMLLRAAPNLSVEDLAATDNWLLDHAAR